MSKSIKNKEAILAKMGIEKLNSMQIEQVMREMGTGYKVNAIYGGRTGSNCKYWYLYRFCSLVCRLGETGI